MRIAVLGTGIIGAPIARHLAEAHHDVVAWNRTIEKAKPLAEHGIRIASDPAEAVDGAELFVTILADAEATDAVMREAVRCAREGTIWWQAGTIGIDGIERMARLADQHGLKLIDGPVLGTRKPAEEGALTVLASGDDDVLDRAEPVLGAPAAKVLRCGPAGAGTRLKLVVNHWIMALMGSIAETVAFARGLGVDPHAFFETIAGGPLDCAYAQTKGAAMIARNYETSFKLKLAAKDTRLALEAAERHDLELRLLPAVMELFDAAERAGHADDDMAAIIEGTTGSTRASAPRA
jgi:3-hydroxyisobutyrate dehydrogenase